MVRVFLRSNFDCMVRLDVPRIVLSHLGNFSVRPLFPSMAVWYCFLFLADFLSTGTYFLVDFPGSVSRAPFCNSLA